MKKPLRVTLKTLGVIAGVVVLALTTTTIINAVASNSEEAKLESYGERVPVDGKKMNLSIHGAGDETIVLLPGFGTAAPALDFGPLVKELEQTHRVVVVEPFGYGFSDTTDTERTSANIVREIHEAVQSLDLDNYVLMGHSIAGIYALDYVNQYPDEVTAFIGIDSSVPTQPGMDKSFPIDAMKAAKFLGLTRILAQLSGDAYAGLPYDEQTKEQMKMLSFKNMLNESYANEMGSIASNFANAQALSFPRDLPVLLFAQANNTGVEGWIPLHEEQAASVDNGELVILDADHYLHHTKSKEIAEAFTRFMAGVGASQQ